MLFGMLSSGAARKSRAERRDPTARPAAPSFLSGGHPVGVQVARPKGTSQYPEDELIVAKMVEGIEAGRFSGCWAAASAFLGQVEGPSDEAKHTRLFRKCKARRAASDTSFSRELGEALRGKSPAEQADLIARLHHSTSNATRKMERTVSELRKRGVRLEDLEKETAGQIIKALLLANSGTDDNGQ